MNILKNNNIIKRIKVLKLKINQKVKKKKRKNVVNLGKMLSFDI